MSANSEPTKKELTEDDMVLAVATAQGVLFEAAKQILARDKTDGIRAVNWMRQHNELFDKICDDYGDLVDDDVIERANKIAGEPD